MSNNAMSNETDLDWLARNVHVWAEDWTHVRKCPVHHEAKWMASLSPNAEYKDWRTKQQWLARRAELQNKPSWETHEYKVIAQGRNGSWYGSNYSEEKFGHESSFCITGTGWNYICSGVDLGDWRDTLEKRPEQTIADICREVTGENRREEIFEPFVSVEDAKITIMQSDGDVKNFGGIIGRNILAKEDAATAKQPSITPSKYANTIHGVSVDVYDVLQAWGVINPALQHLIKKALQCGQRGHKDNAQDLQDIIDSAIRAKELG